MATITEDYVSFETAKLLKEKGFEIDTNLDYWKIGEDGTMYFMCSIGVYTSDKNNPHAFYRPENSYPCPTQQMAMKWLREVHNLYIQTAVTSWPQKGYSVHIYMYNNRYNNFKDLSYVELMQSYEGACEAAIKYCLENLI